MARWLPLLVVPLLVGCHSAPPPTTNINSFRNAYFTGKTLPAPAPAPQVAAMPADVPAANESAAPLSEPKSARGQRGDREAATARPAAAAESARPPRYKASVAAYIKRYAVDANSLKQAKIGTPFPGAVNGQKGSVVCVELDGIKADRTAYLLQGDAVINSEYGAQACQNQHLAPWNERGT